VAEQPNSETPSEAGEVKMDENYYDLDDDFIDDGDLEMMDQYGDMMLYGDGDSKFMSNATSELPAIREDNREEESENKEGLGGADNDESYDPDQYSQQRRYKKILSNFKILMPD
jgi:hypothetical protein